MNEKRIKLYLRTRTRLLRIIEKSNDVHAIRKANVKLKLVNRIHQMKIQCVQPDQYQFQQCECPDCRNRDYLEDAKLDRDQSEREEV